jgi:hypothetical protein
MSPKEVPTPNPLELASTDELVAELKRRHSAVLVVAERQSRETGYDESSVIFSGGTNAAMGMAMRARVVLSQIMAIDHADEGGGE